MNGHAPDLVNGNAPSKPLKVLIVGAGIGGLSAGLALRREGHQCLIFEKSKFASEIGAAIHLAPNCNRLLRRFGLIPGDYEGTMLDGFNLYNEKGEKDNSRNLAGVRQTTKADWHLIHRVDIHNALKQLATTDDGEGPACQLHLACKLVDLDVSKPSITLENGDTFVGDVLLGADGVHSWTRSYITDKRPYPSGKSCFRWLTPVEDLKSDPQTREYFQTPGYMLQWTGPDRHIMAYPCSDNKVMNNGAFIPTEEMGAIQTGYDTSAPKSLLLTSFSTFHPSILAILAKANDSDLRIWELLDCDELPTWTKSSTALLGDAAHPVLPYLGQGGAMAIEDAAVLSAVLPRGTTAEQIPTRLRVYEKCRRERVKKVQDMTRLNGRNQDGGMGERPSGEENMKFSAWVFGFDVWGEAKRALSINQEEGQEEHEEEDEGEKKKRTEGVDDDSSKVGMGMGTVMMNGHSGGVEVKA